MSPLKSVFVFLSLFLAALAHEAQAQETPDQALITGVQLRGSGCQSTEAQVVLSPDFQDLSVLFDNYHLEIGSGSENPNLTSLRKDCQILVDLSIPPNWQLAFRSVDYRGFSALPSSAWAFHRMSVIAQNQAVSSLREATIQGPSNQDYQIHFEQRAERLSWSRCGTSNHSLTFLSQLGVYFYPRTTDRSLAQISLDSADASFRQSFSIEWRRCDPRDNGSHSGEIRPPSSGPVRPVRPRPHF